MKAILILILLALGWFWLTYEPTVTHGPGVLAPETPVQKRVSMSEFPFKGYTLKPLADFEITARVLSKKNYNMGRESDLAPVDLALGWGRMSDSAVLDKISISQGNRWYRWNAREMPIPRREIEKSSANMHMIPANERVEAALKEVNEGHVVTISGKLVAIRSSDGWRWKSSTTRNDTGGGACEIIFVERLNFR